MPKRFLIGQLACFGDCLFATTIAKQIKADFPTSHVTWAIAEKYKSIIELNPHIDDVWVVSISNNDYYGNGWKAFYEEALDRKSNGIYDELIFSQIEPLNWIHFYGTIRGAILNAYKRPITVDIKPVVKLSNNQIERVKFFTERSRISDFKNVVLFESLPGSGQSIVNIEFAINVSISIARSNPDTCFILSSSQKLPYSNSQIIDASELSYIENAELTKYCTHLIGCSSGITWLSTSDWAKKLPMLQLLDSRLSYFAGVNFDFQAFGIDNSNVIEMTHFSRAEVEKCVQAMLDSNVNQIRNTFNQEYKPSLANFYFIIELLLQRRKSFLDLVLFSFRFFRLNRSLGNSLHDDPLRIVIRIVKLKYPNTYLSLRARFSRIADH